ncbi:hypothetical protein BDN67DRAFT_224769 [Paxillus ammoniavirescens]|nr:hypothetical protein BDN67DRAFT_224769 [Paxillus ammoniavirescens]
MQSTLQVPRLPERQGVSIGHLPVELIVMIFHEVYELGLDWSIVAELPTLATVSPNALAMFFSAWRNTLSSVPFFGTRVVITIDGNPTLVKGSFEWPRPLHGCLDFIVHIYAQRKSRRELSCRSSHAISSP